MLNIDKLEISSYELVSSKNHSGKEVTILYIEVTEEGSINILLEIMDEGGELTGAYRGNSFRGIIVESELQLACPSISKCPIEYSVTVAILWN